MPRTTQAVFHCPAQDDASSFPLSCSGHQQSTDPTRKSIPGRQGKGGRREECQLKTYLEYQRLNVDNTLVEVFGMYPAYQRLNVDNTRIVIRDHHLASDAGPGLPERSSQGKSVRTGSVLRVVLRTDRQQFSVMYEDDQRALFTVLLRTSSPAVYSCPSKDITSQQFPGHA